MALAVHRPRPLQAGQRPARARRRRRAAGAGGAPHRAMPAPGRHGGAAGRRRVHRDPHRDQRSSPISSRPPSRSSTRWPRRSSSTSEPAYVSASIGIALYPADAELPEALMRNADQAMYRAKAAGRNQLSFFEPAMQEAAMNRLKLASALRQALPERELELYFQPVIDLASGAIAKAEALLRWHRPGLGLAMPTDFIDIAEETGLIHEIGNWVFTEAAQWSKRWSAMLGHPFQISINKSPIQFQGARAFDELDRPPARSSACRAEQHLGRNHRRRAAEPVRRRVRQVARTAGRRRRSVDRRLRHRLFLDELPEAARHRLPEDRPLVHRRNAARQLPAAPSPKPSS